MKDKKKKLKKENRIVYDYHVFVLRMIVV